MNLPVATIIKEMPSMGTVYVTPDKRRVFLIRAFEAGVRVASYGENKDGVFTYITYMTFEEFDAATRVFPDEMPLSADKYIIGDFKFFHLRDNRMVRVVGYDRVCALVEYKGNNQTSVYLVKASELFFESVLDKAKPFA